MVLNGFTLVMAVFASAMSLSMSLADVSSNAESSLYSQGDRHVRELANRFRSDLNEQYLYQYLQMKHQTGRQYRLSEPDRQHVSPMSVSAVDLFQYNGSQYAVVSRHTLNESYIASVTTDPLSGKLLLTKLAQFSLDSFIGSMYNATYQRSLHDNLIEIKSHVFEGQVLIMAALWHGTTLLFLIKDPATSWTPKYQDSVLSEVEVAGDFVFFEENKRLYMVVAVTYRFVNGVKVTAHQSYMYLLLHGIKWLKIHTVPTGFGATSVTMFRSDPWNYIVIGQKSEGTLVYRHRASSLQLFQHVASFAIVSVQAFSSHHQQYVLLVSAHSNSSILWWTAEQLVVWQNIPPRSPHRPLMFGRVTALPDHSSFIYLVHQSAVTFYSTFNSHDGRFQLAFNFEVQEDIRIRHLLLFASFIHLSHLQAETDFSYHVVMSVERAGSLELYDYRLRVTLSPTFPPVSRSSGLLECLERLEGEVERLVDRVAPLLQLSALVFTRRSPNTTTHVTGAVHVGDKVSVVGPAMVQSISLNSNESLPDQYAEGLENQIEQGRNVISQANDVLDHALTAFSSQTISGNYVFPSITSHSHFHVSSALELGHISGHNTTRLLDQTLKLSGDQLFSASADFHSLSVERLDFAPQATLNGLEVRDLLFSSGDQTILGSYHIENLEILGDMYVTSLNDLPVSSLLLTGQKFRVESIDIGDLQVQSLHSPILNGFDLATWSESSIRLDRNYSFDDVTLPWLEADDVTCRFLNGVECDEYLSSFWTGGARLPELTFLAAPQVKYLNAADVNGIDLSSDVLSSDTDQVVSTSLYVTNLTSHSGLTVDLVNGVALGDQVVLIDQAPPSPIKDIVFTGDVTVSHLHTTDSADSSLSGVPLQQVISALSEPSSTPTIRLTSSVGVDGSLVVLGSVEMVSLNGVHLNHLDRHYWTNNASDLVVDSAVDILEMNVGGSVFSPLINGFTPESLVSLSSDATIEGNLSFVGDTVISDLHLEEGTYVNGVNLSTFADSVVLSSGDQIISGNKVFLDEVYVEDINVGELNYLVVPDDLLLLSEQVKNVSLNFSRDVFLLSDLTSHHDVHVSHWLNGFSPETILKSVFGEEPQSDVLNHTLNIPGNLYFSDLHVEYINGEKFSDLVDKLLQVEENVRLSRKVTISGDATFLSDLSLDRVNGVQWHPYLSSLILSDVGGVVRGDVTFDGGDVSLIGESSVLSMDRLNDITLSRLLQDYLTVDTDQTSGARLVINGSLTAGQLNTSSINDVPPKSLVFRDRPTVLQHPAIFLSSVHFSDLTVRSAEISSCDVSALWEGALRQNQSLQVLSAGLVRTLSLSVLGDVIALDGNSSLISPLSRLVTDNGNFTIHGNIVFEKPLVVNSAQIADYNGYNLTHVFVDALTLEDENISLAQLGNLGGSVRINGTVTSLTSADVGKLSDLDLTSWLENLVLLSDRDVTISGTLTASSLHVSQLTLLGELNGRPSGMFLKTNSTINGDVICRGNITIHNGIGVEGLIDGVNITDFLLNAVSRHDTSISSDILFLEPVHFRGDVDAPTINNLTADDLVLNSEGGSHVVSSHLNVTSLTVEGALCGQVNRANVSQLCGDLLSSGETSRQLVHGELVLPVGSIKHGKHLSQLERLRSFIKEEQLRFIQWMSRIDESLHGLTTNTSIIQHNGGYSIDLAYVLLSGRLAVSDSFSVLAVPGTASAPYDSVVLTSEDHSSCTVPGHCYCRKSDTFSVDETGELFETGMSSAGQVWRFMSHNSLLNVNSGNNHRCGGGNNTSVEIYGVSLDSGEVLPHRINSWPEGIVSRVRVLEFSSVLHLVVLARLNGESTVSVFRFDFIDTWVHLQTIVLEDITDFDLHVVDLLPHLLLVSKSSVSVSQDQILVMIWNSSESQFEELSTLAFKGVGSARFIEGRRVTLIAVADQNGLSLFEYNAVDGGYSLCQFLAEPSLSNLLSFSVGPLKLLAAHDFRRNQIVLFLHVQQDSLRRHSEFPAASVRSVDFMETSRAGLSIIVVAAEDELLLYRVVLRGKQHPVSDFH